MTTLKQDKPLYRIPGMGEIAATPWNGYNVVSLFSGCGGSCLGFEMAGFKILWANEFVPAAQEVYRLNHPGVHLNTQDIRNITPESILTTLGLKAGDLDVLEGSPPCASFSTAGKREKLWGEIKSYSDKKQRTDDLFWEYSRILKGVQPKVFVAENVAGLVRGVAKGYFKRILADLKNCGYNVKCKVLDAQWLGVPQSRKRVIFIGVREDIDITPVFPKPLPYYYSVHDAIPWMGSLRAVYDTGGQWSNGDITNKPCSTILTESHHFTIEPEASIVGYGLSKYWEKLRPGESSKERFNLIKPLANKPSPIILACGGNGGTASVTHPTEPRKFSIAELKRICSFPDDFQLTGAYKKQWERLGRAVPPVMMRTIAESIRDGILKRIGE